MKNILLIIFFIALLAMLTIYAPVAILFMLALIVSRLVSEWMIRAAINKEGIY